jgi:hypothetical protein
MRYLIVFLLLLLFQSAAFAQFSAPEIKYSIVECHSLDDAIRELNKVKKVPISGLYVSNAADDSATSTIRQYFDSRSYIQDQNAPNFLVLIIDFENIDKKFDWQNVGIGVPSANLLCLRNDASYFLNLNDEKEILKKSKMKLDRRLNLSDKFYWDEIHRSDACIQPKDYFKNYFDVLVRIVELTLKNVTITTTVTPTPTVNLIKPYKGELNLSYAFNNSKGNFAELASASPLRGKYQGLLLRYNYFLFDTKKENSGLYLSGALGYSKMDVVTRYDSLVFIQQLKDENNVSYTRTCTAQNGYEKTVLNLFNWSIGAGYYKEFGDLGSSNNLTHGFNAEIHLGSFLTLNSSSVSSNLLSYSNKYDGLSLITNAPSLGCYNRYVNVSNNDFSSVSYGFSGEMNLLYNVCYKNLVGVKTGTSLHFNRYGYNANSSATISENITTNHSLISVYGLKNFNPLLQLIIYCKL